MRNAQHVLQAINAPADYRCAARRFGVWCPRNARQPNQPRHPRKVERGRVVSDWLGWNLGLGWSRFLLARMGDWPFTLNQRL